MSLATKNHEIYKKIKALEEAVIQKDSEIYRLQTLLNNLPNSIYWKNIKGVYLGHNYCAAQKMKSVNLNGNSIVGKTDFDLFLEEVADIFRKNDLEVMHNDCVLIKEEVTCLANGDKLIQLSTKKALYDEKARIIGVIGNTIDISEFKKIKTDITDCAKDKFIFNTKSAFEAIQYRKSGTKKSFIRKNIYVINQHKKIIHLTPRQTECLFFIIMGKTAKIIAKILDISPRTAEEHIDQLKCKFRCSSKNELIEIAIANGFLETINSTIENDLGRLF